LTIAAHLPLTGKFSGKRSGGTGLATRAGFLRCAALAAEGFGGLGEIGFDVSMQRCIIAGVFAAPSHRAGKLCDCLHV
jgi:hypothetical protein